MQAQAALLPSHKLAGSAWCLLTTALGLLVLMMILWEWETCRTPSRRYQLCVLKVWQVCAAFMAVRQLMEAPAQLFARGGTG